MPRPARIHYYDSARLADGQPGRAGELVILSTDDTPEQCRINGYPVFEIVLIQGTSATGPQLTLEGVAARGRGTWDYDLMRGEDPRRWRHVVPADGVERL